jgi:hypothetical protein
MNLRSKLSYANVVATLALVLALTGGTVYAASKLAKDSVKSKNIAKGAVKRPDLGKNAVTSPKVKDGSIGSKDLTAEVLSKLEAEVTGSASAGPVGGLNTATTAPLPLAGTTTFTPGAGEVVAVAAEASFTIATTNPANQCSPDVRLLLDGQPTRVFLSPESGENSTTPVQSFGRDAAGPFGMLAPGVQSTITAEISGDVDCTPGTQLDRVELRTVQIR